MSSTDEAKTCFNFIEISTDIPLNKIDMVDTDITPSTVLLKGISDYIYWNGKIELGDTLLAIS